MLPHDALLALRFEPRSCVWSERDVMLYALGVGMCPDGLDGRELDFVTEWRLRVMPSFATALALNAMPTARDFQCDPVQLLHASQGLTLHRPIPPSGSAVAHSRIVSALDKGARGAVLTVETRLVDAADGAPLATLEGVMFALDGGGIGGPGVSGKGPAASPPAVPDRAPDASVMMTTRPDQALLYRLVGDRNPLHADPDEARRVGFERPILHGLCTYGIGMRAVLATMADYRPERVAAYSIRFAGPVFPGDALCFDLWRDGDIVLLEARVPVRDAVVLRGGVAHLVEAGLVEG
ncbi:MAG: MaoC/PaaZ C-terminal domain-containing protein [Sphingobium sp.]